MTGPYDDGASGIFDHLDDPAGAAPSRDVLEAVVHRGRRLRARRQGAIAMSGAAAVAAAVLGGLGIANSVNAGGHDSLSPADSGSPSVTASATASPRHHGQGGVAIVAPHGRPASRAASPTLPPTSGPCATATPAPSTSPLVDGPIAESSVPPLFPTATPDPCAVPESPSPSESPTPTDSATPTPTGTPTTDPSQPPQ